MFVFSRKRNRCRPFVKTAGVIGLPFKIVLLRIIAPLERYAQHLDDALGVNAFRLWHVVEDIFLHIPEFNVITKPCDLLFGQVANNHFHFNLGCRRILLQVSNWCHSCHVCWRSR